MRWPGPPLLPPPLPCVGLTTPPLPKKVARQSQLLKRVSGFLWSGSTRLAALARLYPGLPVMHGPDIHVTSALQPRLWLEL